MDRFQDQADRLTGAAFGTPDYAKEELTAELGAAFMTAELGVDSDRVQHPSYLANWLAALKQDAKFIFNVASLSKTACRVPKGKLAGVTFKVIGINNPGDLFPFRAELTLRVSVAARSPCQHSFHQPVTYLFG